MELENLNSNDTMATMSNTFETDFISEVIYNPNFSDPSTNSVFSTWCEINDSIHPEFVSREEWEKKKGKEGFIEEGENESKTLYLPTDLHLWEMVDVFESIDTDTFSRKPELVAEKVKKIEELGETFEKAGRYLNEYISTIGETTKKGQQLANEMAQKFYSYGLSLKAKEKRDEEIPPNIPKLTENEKTEIDEWFLGSPVYQNRLKRLGENVSEPEREEYRKSILKGFFRALSKEGYQGQGDNPWEIGTGPAKHIQNQTEEGIRRAIKAPETEIGSAIFRRGIAKLVTEMETANKDFVYESEKLYDMLKISELKSELERVRRIGNIELLSEKELEIAKKIDKEVRSFPYNIDAGNPSEMLREKYINCVGASILGGAFLDELGIKYLNVSIPNHSTTILLTSNNEAYWQDFTPPLSTDTFNYTKVKVVNSITDEEINLQDFLDTRFKNSEFVNIYIDGFRYPIPAQLYKPEIGLQIQLLSNKAAMLNELGRFEEAVQVCKRGISIDYQYPFLYNNLGNSLNDLGRFEEAVKVYKQGINIDPEDVDLYYNLSISLDALGDSQEAVKVCKKALTINPKYPPLYINLGNLLQSSGSYDQAVEVYKQGISFIPEYFPLYNDLGNLLEDLGHYEEAVQAYRQAIAIDPQHPSLYHNLGNSLKNLHRYEEEVEVYKQGISINPQDSYLYECLSNSLNTLSRYEEAVQAYRQGISNNPQSSFLYDRLGISLNNLNRYEEALEIFKQGIGMNPKDPLLYIHLGHSLEGLGRYKEAIEIYEHCLIIDPTYSSFYKENVLRLSKKDKLSSGRNETS